MQPGDEQAAALAALLRDYPGTARTAGFAERIADPSPGQRRHCYLALEVAHHVLRDHHRDPMTAVPDAIAGSRGARQRSAIARVRMYTRTLLLHLPTGVRLADQQVKRARKQLTAAEQAMQPERSAGLFVKLPAGPVIAAEVHPATRVDGTRDLWMSRRVAAHLQLGKHIPGFAGVVVLAPRWDAASAHMPTTGVRHRLGDCDVCQQVTLAARGWTR